MPPLLPIAAPMEGTSYLVRIEMPDPTTRDQYELLHERMAGIRFLKAIQGDTGLWYQLPDAEYHGHSRLDCAQLRDVVRFVTDSVRVGAKVLVTEAPRSAWYLPPAA